MASTCSETRKGDIQKTSFLLLENDFISCTQAGTTVAHDAVYAHDAILAHPGMKPGKILGGAKHILDVEHLLKATMVKIFRWGSGRAPWTHHQ